MKYLFFNVFLMLLFNSCTAQTQKNKKMTTSLTDKEIKELGYQIKKEDTIFMKNSMLDVSKLEKEGTSNGTSVPTDDGWKSTKSYNYSETLGNGTHINIRGNDLSGYSKIIREKDSDFETFYGYYFTGNLKNTGNYYITKFNNGIRYSFDKKGSIDKYENFDAPYKFTWEDVLKFIEDQKIKKEDIQNIYRGELNGVHGWEIIYKPKEFLKTDNVKVLTLDAKTGEISNTEIRDTSRHLD